MLYSPFVGQCIFGDEETGCQLDPAKKPTLAKTLISFRSIDFVQINYILWNKRHSYL